ncbi:MAG: DUF177 domain-containing protein [Alphaproteobacteria bacterium]|nr:MAG: DUF177 domain-containing protein [Alphaproteobacteria bacterium]
MSRQGGGPRAPASAFPARRRITTMKPVKNAYDPTSAMTAHETPRPEFSRLFDPDRLGREDIIVEIAANAEARAALARRFDLLELAALSATLRVRQGPGRKLISVEGRFVADVVQACVVSLEPVASHLDEAFVQRYTLDPATVSGEASVIVNPEAEDPPELVGPAGIDLGEAVAQQLAVSLDPYPRAPGACLPESVTGAGGSDGSDSGNEKGSENPFAVLQGLKPLKKSR